jgi:hypothetical protein
LENAFSENKNWGVNFVRIDAKNFEYSTWTRVATNFKSYDELKEKLNRVITGTRNTATVESADLPSAKTNSTVKSNGKTTPAASDDDDTLSYFSKLADDE